ncbi:hypothetical protein HZC21_04525 [Candidatus Peregrinibacteria bacterium]|nr:hypothetical protein [Candidatus Peregrinibacteria bacterium]
MNTQPDRSANPETPVESVTPLKPAATVQPVNAVSGDVANQVGDVIEQESRHLCERARQLMQEADQWDSELKRSADMQTWGAAERARRTGCINLEDSISFNRERDSIRRWRAGDGRREFMGKVLEKLLEALEMIKGRFSQEACILKDELVAKFSSLLGEYERTKSDENVGEHYRISNAHREFLGKFLKTARGIDGDELSVGLEKSVKAGIDKLIEYYDWEGSMDTGMNLLKLVCPFYRTTAGKKMFEMVMQHLDRLMKMNLCDWLTAPSSQRWMREYPDRVKEEEKEWKDCYQKAADDILRRNNLPEHKFEREGGGFATGNHWG